MFSPCRRYRYALHRVLDPAQGVAMPLPERDAYARWLADTYAPALRKMDSDSAHAAGYAAGVAAERERCAAVCERRADSLTEGGAVARQCARDIRNGA